MNKAYDTKKSNANTAGSAVSTVLKAVAVALASEGDSSLTTYNSGAYSALKDYALDETKRELESFWMLKGTEFKLSSDKYISFAGCEYEMSEDTTWIPSKTGIYSVGENWKISGDASLSFALSN